MLAASIALPACVMAASVWKGAGWYQIAYAISIGEDDPLNGSLTLYRGPFASEQSCRKALPNNKVEPALFPFDLDTRIEYWCDEVPEHPLWEHGQRNDGTY